MLQPYNNQSDIPEPFREHYSRRDDGKWHADISNDHPAVRHGAKLLSEKTASDEKAATLQGELERAQDSGLPRGHVAVPKADADFLAEVKAHGPADEVKAKLAEHGPLKQAEARRAKEKGVRALAADMGWDVEQAALLLTDSPDLPDTFKRDGKVFAKVKREDGAEAEELFADVFERTDKLKALLPSLNPSGQRRAGHGRDPNPSGASTVFDRIRADRKEQQEAAPSTGRTLADIAGRAARA